MKNRQFDSIDERLNYIEFRQQLLFENDEVSRLLFENQITEIEYRNLMDLMDSYRAKLDNGEEVFSGEYEQKVYEIIPSKYGDYHFCEHFAESLYEQNRWEEVFPALYSHSPKYSFLKDKK